MEKTKKTFALALCTAFCLAPALALAHPTDANTLNKIGVGTSLIVQQDINFPAGDFLKQYGRGTDGTSACSYPSIGDFRVATANVFSIIYPQPRPL